MSESKEQSFESLAEEAPALRERINIFRRSLGRFFVGKQGVD